MNEFLRICLLIFAGCAVLGLIPAAVLAARARKPAMALLALFIAAFVAGVLITAAGDLR